MMASEIAILASWRSTRMRRRAAARDIQDEERQIRFAVVIGTRPPS
jgi:hypothetical protein